MPSIYHVVAIFSVSLLLGGGPVGCRWVSVVDVASTAATCKVWSSSVAQGWCERLGDILFNRNISEGR